MFGFFNKTWRGVQILIGALGFVIVLQGVTIWLLLDRALRCS